MKRDNETITARELADLIGVGSWRVQEWCKQGKLKAEKDRLGQWIIQITEIKRAEELSKQLKPKPTKLEKVELVSKPPCKDYRKVEEDLYFCPKYELKLRGGAGLCINCERARRA